MASPFNTPAFGKTGQPASDAAVDYLRNLMTEKAVSKGHNAEFAQVNINAWLARNTDKTTVSANIDRLKAEGFTGRTASGSHAKVETVVPAGRYAVETGNGATNSLAFYKVDRPETGKWAGYVFVKLMISDDEQRLGKTAAAAVLAKIAEVGPEAAMARARGIGPVCAAKAGW